MDAFNAIMQAAAGSAEMERIRAEIRRFTILILSMLSLCVASSAQITISGTVADKYGNPYQNGSGRAVLVSGNGSGQQAWTVNASNPVQSPIVISGLDSFGHFSVSLTSTAVIDQQGAAPQWQFSFCANPAIQPQVCFPVPPMALTSSQDISAQIQSAAAPLPITSLAQFLSLNNTWTGANTFSGATNPTSGTTGQIAILNNGTSTAPGSQNMMVFFPSIQNVQIGYQCTGGTSPPLCNMNQIIGGEITGTNASGSIGIDIEAGADTTLYNPVVAGYDTGLKVNSPSAAAIAQGSFLNIQNNATQAILFTSNSQNNWVATDSAGPFTDSGSSNTIAIANAGYTQKFDLSFVRWANFKDNAINLIIQPGTTADQQGVLQFNDHSGNKKWTLDKDSANGINIHDSSGNPYIGFTTTSSYLNGGFSTSNPVNVNSSTNAATGGFQVWSGGASPTQRVLIGNTATVGIAFLQGKGQHFNTQAANNDLFGTCSSGSGTTCTVSFATSYSSTPSCVPAPTFAATSWYVSAQSNSGFTITYAPSGASSFNYHCGGNPN